MRKVAHEHASSLAFESTKKKRKRKKGARQPTKFAYITIWKKTSVKRRKFSRKKA